MTGVNVCVSCVLRFKFEQTFLFGRFCEATCADKDHARAHGTCTFDTREKHAFNQMKIRSMLSWQMQIGCHGCVIHLYPSLHWH